MNLKRLVTYLYNNLDKFEDSGLLRVTNKEEKYSFGIHGSDKPMIIIYGEDNFRSYVYFDQLSKSEQNKLKAVGSYLKVQRDLKINNKVEELINSL